jgi:hypothetical protein
VRDQVRPFIYMRKSRRSNINLEELHVLQYLRVSVTI